VLGCLPGCTHEQASSLEAPTVEAGPTVEVTLDGAPLSKVVLTADSAVDVATLLPEEVPWTTVKHVLATSQSTVQLGVRNPSIRHPGATATLSLTTDGRALFTLVPAVRPDASAQVQAARASQAPTLAGVSHLAVSIGPPPSPPDPPEGAPLRLHIPGHGRVTMSAGQLAQLPTHIDPRGKDGAWRLVDILQAHTGPRTVREVIVEQKNGQSTPLRLDDPGAVVLVKYNRDGELRIQEWSTTSDSPKPTAVHRNITAVRVPMDVLDAPN